MAWLLFHVALHKDVQKNLTVEVKNSISRGVSKYLANTFSFVEAECSLKEIPGSLRSLFIDNVCLFVCLSSLR